jgi:hypothetical protein
MEQAYDDHTPAASSEATPLMPFSLIADVSIHNFMRQQTERIHAIECNATIAYSPTSAKGTQRFKQVSETSNESWN